MFPNCTHPYVGVGPTYGVDGGMCPLFQGIPWTKFEDPVGPLWAVCVEEVGTVGTLGILVTIPLEEHARLVGAGG